MKQSYSLPKRKLHFRRGFSTPSFNSLLIGNFLENNNEINLKKYKNVSREEFRKNPFLWKIAGGKYGNIDNDYKNGKPVLNWNDCFPFDKKRHAVIPAQLQAKRPVIPLTLAQYKAQRQPQQTQQQAIQTATQVAQQVEEIPQSQFSEMDWYKAAKMALSGKGESGITYGTSKLYNYIMGKEQIETSGLSGQEQKILKELKYKVQSGYAAKQEGALSLSQSDILKNLYAAQTGQITGIPTTKTVGGIETTTTNFENQQYSQPIGPSRPIGYDTQGKPVFPEKIATKTSEVYIPPSWSGEKIPKVTYETYRPVELTMYDRSPFLKGMKEGVTALSKKVESITSLGLSERPQQYTTENIPSVTGMKATMVTQPIPTAKLQSKERYNREFIQLQGEYAVQSEMINEDVNTKYQNLINSGAITYEDALQQSEQEFNIRTARLSNDYNEKISKAQDEMQRGIMREEYPAALVSGIVTGAVSTLSAPIGVGLAVLGGANLLFNWEETKETFVKYPEESLTTLGLGIGGFFAGGKAVKGIRSYATSLKENPVFEVYKKPEGFKGTSLKETFPEEILFKPKVSPEGRIRAWEFQKQIEADSLAFQKKYPPLIENKPIDFIVKIIPDEAVKKPLVKRIRTITDIFPEETKPSVSQIQKSGQVQQLLYKTEVQEVKQVQLPKSVLKRRVNLISQTSPIGLLTSLPLMSESRFSLAQSQKQKQLQKLKQLETISQSQFSSLLFSQEQKQETKQKQKQVSALSFAQPQIQLEKQKERQRYFQPQISSLLFKQQELQKQKERQLYIQKFRTPQREITTLKEPTRKPLSFYFPMEKIKTTEENYGYIPFVRLDATKKQKARWKQISNVPQTRLSALSSAGGYVDKNISAKFKVQKVKLKPGQKPREMSNTWSNIEYKFRPYVQRKGQKLYTPNQFIEKQSYRADKPNEKRALRIGKVQSINNLIFSNNNKKRMFRI